MYGSYSSLGLGQSTARPYYGQQYQPQYSQIRYTQPQVQYAQPQIQYVQPQQFTQSQIQYVQPQYAPQLHYAPQVYAPNYQPSVPTSPLYGSQSHRPYDDRPYDDRPYDYARPHDNRPYDHRPYDSTRPNSQKPHDYRRPNNTRAYNLRPKNQSSKPSSPKKSFLEKLFS